MNRGPLSASRTASPCQQSGFVGRRSACYGLSGLVSESVVELIEVEVAVQVEETKVSEGRGQRNQGVIYMAL